MSQKKGVDRHDRCDAPAGRNIFAGRNVPLRDDAAEGSAHGGVIESDTRELSTRIGSGQGVARGGALPFLTIGFGLRNRVAVDELLGAAAFVFGDTKLRRGEARLGTRFERRGARRAAVELCEERPCGHGRASLDERSNDTPRRSRGDIGLLRRGERTRDEDVSGHLALGGDDGLDMSRRRGSRRDLLSARRGAVTAADGES